MKWSEMFRADGRWVFIWPGLGLILGRLYCGEDADGREVSKPRLKCGLSHVLEERCLS